VSAGTTLRDARRSALEQVIIIGHNVISTLVPHPLHVSTTLIQQPSRYGFVRDYFFLLYQTSLIPAIGSVGGVLVLVLLARRLRLPVVGRPRTKVLVMAGAVLAAVVLSMVWPISRLVFEWFPTHVLLVIGLAAVALAAGAVYSIVRGWRVAEPWERWFWRAWIVVAPLAGIPMSASRQEHGAAHMFMIPAVVVAGVFLAAHIDRLPRSVRWALAVGLAVDFALGILLQFGLQSLTFGPDGGAVATDSHGLLKQAVLNWVEKESVGVQFWGDHAPSARWPVLAGIVVAFAVAVWVGVIRTPHSGQRSGEARRS
jgi:hypothetical protein